MPSQAAIERKAGIANDDIEFAKYISTAKTDCSNNVIALLRMQVNFYEEAGMALLQEAVKDCRKEFEEAQRNE